ARLVLDVDAAVLERVDLHAEVGRVAGVIDAVLVPGRRVRPGGGRVRLVVLRGEGLVDVPGALVRGVRERAARSLGGLEVVRRRLSGHLGRGVRRARGLLRGRVAAPRADHDGDDHGGHRGRGENAAAYELQALSAAGGALLRLLALDALLAAPFLLLLATGHERSG